MRAFLLCIITSAALFQDTINRLGSGFFEQACSYVMLSFFVYLWGGIFQHLYAGDLEREKERKMRKWEKFCDKIDKEAQDREDGR